MRNITREELKSASLEQLEHICEEAREEILSTVSQNGGHLSSNLGTVELTVALHRVFSFPQDKLLFDVGHQCYTHKLLTGRAERFSTLRREGGLSGFPKRSESEYDCFDTGHAGTAISAALGIAKARDLAGENFEVVALVGDGSFHNGLIYEALNSLRALDTRILIVLNDNGLSISKTSGGMHDVLEELKAGDADVRLLERFGLKYFGVYDGNDLRALLPALEEAKCALQTGSVLLHVSTKKGKGYPFAEEMPSLTHGVARAKAPAMREYSAALGEELIALAEKDTRVVAVTAAMTDPLGLRPFFDRFPARSFDVGICEEHAAVLSAALASGGMKPYFAIYSTFLQRSFDEVVHDICGQDLPVTLCIDRAGVVGEDGETHQGVFDLSFLSLIPNLTIGIPKNVAEFRAMLRASAAYEHPFAIRYPRAGEEGEVQPLEMGKFEVLHSTMSDIAILAAGERCLKIAEDACALLKEMGIQATLINARFLKPLDEELLVSLSAKYIFTVEDNSCIGGLGDAVRRFFAGSERKVFSFAHPDAFIPHGEVGSLMRRSGISAEHLAEEIARHARR